jgi:hypothetical protein
VRRLASEKSTVLLAPSGYYLPPTLCNTHLDADRYDRTLSEVQRLRGRIYLEENAIGPRELTSSGRHCLDGDQQSWHLLSLDANEEVCGCARYLSHENTTPFSELTVRHAADGQPAIWGENLHWAIEADLSLARQRNFQYAELGGWALREDLRHSTAAIRIVLLAYALARHLWGCIGVTTASTRHCSSTILRRMGGQPLLRDGTELASYYDPRYKCEMMILRFDSDMPNPRYETWVEEIREQLIGTPVICRMTSGDKGEPDVATIASQEVFSFTKSMRALAGAVDDRETDQQFEPEPSRRVDGM